MKEVTLEQFVGGLDVSKYEFDICVPIEEINGEKYVIVQVHDIFIAEPRICVIDSEKGIVQDKDGTMYHVRNWQDNFNIYILVEETQYQTYTVINPYPLLKQDIF